VASWIGLIAGLLGVILIGTLPPVVSADALIRQHARGILAVTIGGSVLGLLLLVHGWMWAARTTGRAMTRDELDALSARTQMPSPGARFSVARFRGRFRGVTTDPDVE
jgi:hypothetical protein